MKTRIVLSLLLSFLMTVSYRGLDASEQTLDFERDQVDYLKVDKSDLTVIDEVKGDESRIRFDLTRKGVVGICGLQQADRIMVCSLDGKSAVSVCLALWPISHIIPILVLRIRLWLLLLLPIFQIRLLFQPGSSGNLYGICGELRTKVRTMTFLLISPPRNLMMAQVIASIAFLMSFIRGLPIAKS